MAEAGHDDVTFAAIRQFVVAPDRRYQVEWRDDALEFNKTGSQFDTQWLARGARSVLGDRIADTFERCSPTKLVFGGIGVAAASALLLLVVGVGLAGSNTPLRGSHIRGIGVLVFAFIVGLIMTIAGVASRRRNATNPRHDFRVELLDVVDATLLPPQSELARRGEPQVARLHLQDRSGRTIRLGIPTDADLDTVKSVIPRLAA